MFALRARPVCALALVASCLWLPAGAETLQPIWSRDFGRPIHWQRMTASGQLLVDTGTGLESIDPATGMTRWSLSSLAGTDRSQFRELAGTPLALVDGGRGDGRVRVLNIFTGAVVFDSRSENLTKIVSTQVLPASGSLLIAGFEQDNPRPTLFLFGIEDGRRLWASDALDADLGGFQSLLLAAVMAAMDADPVQSPPLELGDGSFLLGAMSSLYRFDTATGKVLWKAPFTGGRYTLVRSELHPGIVLVGANEIDTVIGSDSTRETASASYQAFRIDDGEPLWNRPERFNQAMSERILPLAAGFVVGEADSGKGRLHLLAAATGERPWGKRGRGLEIAGQVVDYAPAGSDFIVTTGYDSIWTNRDTEYQLYVLDPIAGSFRFETPVATRGRLLRTELVGSSLVYLTTHEIGRFDPATGEHQVGLSSKEALVSVDDGRGILAFDADDGLVYRFDRDTGAVAAVSATEFEFTDRDAARSLDLVDGRIVLLGAQTVAGFSRAGALEFHEHYRAPRDPAWLRSLAWAEGVRAGMASAYAGVYSAAAAQAAGNAADGSVGQELAEELSRGFGDLQQGYAGLAGDYVSFARRRYEASAESRDFAFLMYQDENRSVWLAAVSKRDGSIVSRIDMGRDKAPDYEVDDVTGTVFYRPSESAIHAFAFTSP